MIGLVCEKGEKSKVTLELWLTKLVVYAVRQRVGRGGGAGLTEKMMSTVSTC